MKPGPACDASSHARGSTPRAPQRISEEMKMPAPQRFKHDVRDRTSPLAVIGSPACTAQV